MRFVFIHAEKALYPVRVLCSVLGVSRSGYYAWIARPRAARAQADEQLVVEIVAAHRRSRATYGSPRVHSELRTRGTRVGRKRIERLMRERGIRARRKRRFRRTTDSRHAYPIAPNVLGRRFAVKSANAVWVTDVTSIWTGEGWTFLAVMLDLFARRVVGWAASETNDTALALAVLDSALRERSPPLGSSTTRIGEVPTRAGTTRACSRLAVSSIDGQYPLRECRNGRSKSRVPATT